MSGEPEHGITERDATYQEDEGLSCMYLYVVPRNEFPSPDDLVSEARECEITLDYERSTGRLLGVEVVTQTAQKEASK